jgi:hypothetical protein
MEQLCLMSLAGEIDRLFQLPLSEFTPARNELLKRAPAQEKLHIQALHKPNVPAWAVNQLYWRERKVYDLLVRTAERLRAAHAQTIKGRSVDLAAVELPHAAAVKRAADRVRDILARSGDAATSATMNAVMDTLQALPGGGEPGRLTRPLAPLGFGALSAIVKGAKTPKGLAEIVTFARPKPPKPNPEVASAEAKRAKAEADKRQREIETELKGLDRELAAARKALTRAEAAKADADREVERSAADVSRRRAEVDRIERDVRRLRERQ